MNNSPCPCRSGKDFKLCCEPFVEGSSVAPTPELLMRSRYTAYALGKIDYIFETTAPESRPEFDRPAVTQWSRDSVWLGLDVHNTEGGVGGETEGWVEFTAHYVLQGQTQAHHERSLFRRDSASGRWYFVKPDPRRQRPVVKAPEPGRNDPCSCGSGRKYKKCCAA